MLLTKITIDVNKPLYTKLTAKSGDMKSRFIEFHMYNGVEPLSLDHCHVRFYMIKPDNTIIFNDLVKNSNDGILFHQSHPTFIAKEIKRQGTVLCLIIACFYRNFSSGFTQTVPCLLSCVFYL